MSCTLQQHYLSRSCGLLGGQFPHKIKNAHFAWNAHAHTDVTLVYWWEESRKYCHISGLSWRIIMGSGLDDWIYWHFFTITINHDSSRLTPFLAGLLVPSFLCDWLVSDLRVGHFFSFRCPLVSTLQLNTQLCYEWIRMNSRMNSLL
jgi:hypothetical protein